MRHLRKYRGVDGVELDGYGGIAIQQKLFYIKYGQYNHAVDWYSYSALDFNHLGENNIIVSSDDCSVRYLSSWMHVRSMAELLEFMRDVKKKTKRCVIL